MTGARRYQFNYDAAGGLRCVITPDLARHHFHAATLLDRRRFLYRPPAPGSAHASAGGVFVQDRDSDGHVLAERYPSGARQVEYRWDRAGRLVGVYHDWTDVTISYVDQQVRYSGCWLSRYSCKLATPSLSAPRHGPDLQNFLRFS